MRITDLLRIAGCLALAAGTLPGQQPAAGPAFEVASIKPSPQITPAMVASGKIHAGLRVDASRVDIGQFPLIALICKAYDVKPYQVTGPDWLKSMMGAQRFDIVAKMPAGATKEQVPQMLQALLAERFKLTISRSTKEQKVFALIPEKTGLKAKEAAEPKAEEPAPGEAPAKPAATGSNQTTFKTTGNSTVISDGERESKVTMNVEAKMMHLESTMTMDELAQAITLYEDRPVLDMTGLKGKYQIILDISMEDAMGAARRMGATVPTAAPGGGDAAKPAENAEDPGVSSVRQSLKALGLKLEGRKAPLEQIVVERIEKMPTEN